MIPEELWKPISKLVGDEGTILVRGHPISSDLWDYEINQASWWEGDTQEESTKHYQFIELKEKI